MPRGIYVRRPKPIEQRFWPKIEKSGECWTWTGHRSKNGYGYISGISQKTGKRTMLLAHRIMWELTYGSIPDGMCVCHTCDRGASGCVTPHHLFLGTHAENMADSSQKGRTMRGRRSWVRGELHGKAKLSEANVLDIRRRYTGGGVYQRELASEFNVSEATIQSILKHRNWSHLP